MKSYTIVLSSLKEGDVFDVKLYLEELNNQNVRFIHAFTGPYGQVNKKMEIPLYINKDFIVSIEELKD